MGSKKSTPKGAAEPSTSSNGTDPVYAQRLPDSQPSQTSYTHLAGDTATPKDDPVYSPADSDVHRNGKVNDPVYSQTSTAPPAPGPGAKAHTPGTGDISGANDPVYSQSSSIRGQANDPVYSQKLSVAAVPGPGPLAYTPGTGDISSSNDPVYSQSSSVRGQVNDPVYSQKFSAEAVPGPGPLAHTPGTGNISSANDPVSSQPESSKIASTRLAQLSSQVSPEQSEPQLQPNTSRTRRKTKANKADELPADYSDIMGHIQKMQAIVENPDTTSRGYQRQKTSGKLHSRERIHALLDPGTYREIGSVTGTTRWVKDANNPQSEHIAEFTPSNNPQGFGRVTTPSGPRQVYLTSDDFSIRSGHADGSVQLKTVHGEKLALRLKVPVIKLVDGSSGGGSVSTIITQGYSYLPHVVVLSTVVKQLNQGIPNLGAALGPAIGLGAARVVSTHFSVMAGDIGSMFNAGPKVVEGATFEEGLSFQDLGGPAVHCTNGTFDNLARDEAECFAMIKTVLGFLPDCGDLQAPPVVACDDPVDREDLALRSIIPRRKARGYNPYAIIESVVDRGSWFEIGGQWGRTAIAGLARMGGRPVGILSNNCEVNSGALDALGSQKLLKHIKFCDVFNLPIVQFVDVPGYAIGTTAERTATMKWGVALAMAYYTSTTPIFSIITRRVYGVAGGVMLDSRDPIMRVAWPSGTWGSLPLDGGIEVGHRHELNEIRQKEGEAGWKRRYKELEDEYLRLMNPVRSGNVFNVEEIIDPKDTRRVVSRWVKEMYGVVMHERLVGRQNGSIRAWFT